MTPLQIESHARNTLCDLIDTTENEVIKLSKLLGEALHSLRNHTHEAQLRKALEIEQRLAS